MAELPPVFTDLLKTATLEQKHAMLEALSKDLSRLEMKSCPPKSEMPLDAHTFVEHVTNLGIDEPLYKGIEEELLSLDLKKPGRGVKSKWLAANKDLADFKNIFKSPLSINEFPNISKLMDIVNMHPSTTGDMNSFLVTRYPSNRASLSLHCDNEKIISQCSSICTVSFGAPRELQTVFNGKLLENGKPDTSPDLTLPAIDKTMNVMKPGAQNLIKQAVRPSYNLTDAEDSQVRFSISFRKIIPIIEEEAQETEAPVDRLVNSNKNVSHKKIIVLIAGDSFAARLKADLPGKGKKEVINIAKGGRKIPQVQKDIEDFLTSNPDVLVSKLFISIGANDIRHCEDDIRHLKSALCNLMRAVKLRLPNAKIWFQSLPPINPNGSKYLPRNVLKINTLIYNLCSRFKLFYLNIFFAFLNRQGNINSNLFPEYDPVKKCLTFIPIEKGWEF